MNAPSIEAIKALDGKIFSMLTSEESKLLDFYRQHANLASQLGLSTRPILNWWQVPDHRPKLTTS
jgi:hypothetical protein